jgi:RecA/RadA recombinase
MARTKETDTKPSDIDAIIDTVSKGMNLPPTNLQRGNLVKDAVSTGSLALDLTIGGGWPPGRRSNVFGKEQVGKSTLLYFAVKACIAQRIYVVFYDWEGSTDTDRVERIGVKTNWLKELKAKEPVYFRYFDRMKHGQQMFGHSMQILDSLEDRDIGPVQVAFFCDSLPTVVPAAQAEDSETGANAIRAQLYSNQLPLIKSRLSAKRCIWIDTNQIRTNPRSSFGNPEYEMCGEAVKTLSDVRVKAKKAIPPKGRGRPERKKYDEEEQTWDLIGVDRYNFAHLTVVKNKAFSPNRECMLRILFESCGEPGSGIDPVFDCYEYLRLTGQIQYHARPHRHFTLAIEPFCNERVVTVPQVDPKTKDPVHDPKTGEVKMMEDKQSTWTWAQLKELVLNPANRKGKWNLVEACRRQITDGTAFQLYFETVTAAAMRGLGKEAAED